MGQGREQGQVQANRAGDTAAWTAMVIVIGSSYGIMTDATPP
jgi:hypothetical protein